MPTKDTFLLRKLIREMAVYDPSEGSKDQTLAAALNPLIRMCNSLGDKQLLFRGFSSPLNKGVIRVTTEGLADKGRMAIIYNQKGSTLKQFIEALAERWGLNSVVYCSTKGRLSLGIFGTQYIVFPEEPWNVIYNKAVGDSGVWTNEKNARTPEEIAEAVESYTEVWPPADAVLNEVILDTPAYYLANFSWLKQTADRLEEIYSEDMGQDPRLENIKAHATDYMRREEEKNPSRWTGITMGKKTAGPSEILNSLETYAQLALFLDKLAKWRPDV